MVSEAKKGALLVLILLWGGVFLPSLGWSQEGEPAPELAAEEIMARALERNMLGFRVGHGLASLRVYDRAGELRERQFEVRSKRVDGQARTLMTLTSPAEVRGQAFLFAENSEGADELWMYVPAFKVTRQVEGPQKRGAFLGSHFTLADLEGRDLRHASYSRKDDEAIGEHPVFVIEARPKNPEVSDYGRLVASIRQSDFLTLQVRFFDKNDAPTKTLLASRITTTEEGFTFVEELTLRAEEGGHSTILIPSLDTSVEISDSLFSVERLGP